MGGVEVHRIFFYRDRRGNSPVKDYLKELDAKGGKDARIKRTKIREYVKALEVNGTNLPENYCKLIEGEIWELRPLSERVFFFGWYNGSFVLLHHFTKKTQKTPRLEIDKAKREMEDFIERWNENGTD